MRKQCVPVYLRLSAFVLTASLLLLGGCSSLPGTGADIASQAEESAQEAVSSSSSSSASSSSSSTASRRLSKRKAPATTADILKSISYAHSKNPDTVGWLTIPGTDIDGSVLQSHDNVYYLRRTEKGTEDIYGCYFADYECSFGPRDQMLPNTVIYGHSDLKDNPEGPKFSQLFRFIEEPVARENPCLTFSTVYEHMTWEIFAAFYTDTNLSYTAVHLDASSQAKLIEDARARSILQYDITLNPGEEKLLTLSTCSVKYGTQGDERFVVMARLLPADAPIPTEARVSVNETSPALS